MYVPLVTSLFLIHWSSWLLPKEDMIRQIGCYRTCQPWDKKETLQETFTPFAINSCFLDRMYPIMWGVQSRSRHIALLESHKGCIASELTTTIAKCRVVRTSKDLAEVSYEDGKEARTCYRAEVSPSLASFSCQLTHLNSNKLDNYQAHKL